MTFAMFFLGEYANMILMSAYCTTLFLGGWLPRLPRPGFHPRLRMVRFESRGMPVRLHLGPRNPAALPLRPADAARVESVFAAVAARGCGG